MAVSTILSRTSLLLMNDCAATNNKRHYRQRRQQRRRYIVLSLTGRWSISHDASRSHIPLLVCYKKTSWMNERLCLQVRLQEISLKVFTFNAIGNKLFTNCWFSIKQKTVRIGLQKVQVISFKRTKFKTSRYVKNSTSGVNRTKILSEDIGPCPLLTRPLQFENFHIDLFEFLRNFDYPCNTVDLIRVGSLMSCF